MESSLRPTPDYLMLTGSLLALAGYLLPWFRPTDSHDWSFSGWEYAGLSTGGGWTLLTFGWLLLPIGASLWARGRPGAASTAVVGVVGSIVFSLAVVAASFGAIGERDNLNRVADIPFGLGLPLLALGLGLVLVTGIRGIAAPTAPTAGPPIT